MPHSPRFRSFLAMLLAVCLVGMSLWSYGAEATADLLSDEMAHFSAPDGDSPTDHDHDAVAKTCADKPCNHGCHALSHLAGAECHNESFAPIPPAAERIDSLRVGMVLTRPSDGPFRPPRLSFQA